MNFEFKSTFETVRNAIKARPVRYYALRLLANTASIGVVTALYLSNHLLPAVIISRPFGLLYFALAMAAIAFKMAVGATHTIALLIKCYAPVREWTANQLMKRNTVIRLSQRYLYWVASRSTINQTQKL
jgi:hypothetical protein